MRWVLALAVVAALVPPAARAQFYDLDGAYRCVTAADQACGKDDAGRAAAAQQAEKKSDAAPVLADAIERVKRRAATEGDIALIERRAAAKDPRAVEVLAWCKLNGIGMKPDALAAFWLYREAAGLGVANAGRNQLAIFETRLTSAERQQVLMKENAR
jgi:TPR repeat protein